MEEKNAGLIYLELKHFCALRDTLKITYFYCNKNISCVNPWIFLISSNIGLLLLILRLSDPNC